MLMKENVNNHSPYSSSAYLLVHPEAMKKEATRGF